MMYFRSLSMLIGRSISSPSKSMILVAPPDIIFLMIKGLDHLGFIFSLRSKVSSLSTFRTKPPSLRFLGFTFLLNVLAILFWYPYAWYCALDLFSSIKANCSYLALGQSSSRTLVSTNTLKDCIFISIGSTGSFSAQSLHVTTILARIFFTFLLATSMAPFACGRYDED